MKQIFPFFAATAGLLAYCIPVAVGELPLRIPVVGTAAHAVPLSVRLPGEFERQQLLLLSCAELSPEYADTIAKIANATRRRIHVVILYALPEQRAFIKAALRRQMASLENITLFRMAHDSKWIRDYGPTVLRTGDGKGVAVDWCYQEDRPNDDRVPTVVAHSTDTPVWQMPLVVEGGNLLSNGQGLCLTTTSLVDRNASIIRLNEMAICTQLQRLLGARQVIVLEPLVGELTGHVDMFVTFTDSRTVVVGQYSADEDPVNAAVLDRNAARLAKVAAPQGPLRVERIPMGFRLDGSWRTYTNCIYANGVLLVPRYRHGDPARFQRALALYRRLLPGWKIVPVDSSELIAQGGSLHCASLNIPYLVRPFKTKDPPAPHVGIAIR